MLLLRAFAAPGLRRAAAAASATALPTARQLLVARLSRLLRRALRILLLRPLLLLLLRPLRAIATRLLLLSLWLLLSGALSARTLPLPRLLALVAADRFSGALLELADLFLHEALTLTGELHAELVMSTVGTTLPSLGVGLLAGNAGDAFRQRHREIGAHCTLRAVDESRRRTLEALLQLAGESSPAMCWDDQRAIDLLRRQATADELRELGADENLLEHIFSERP